MNRGMPALQEISESLIRGQILRAVPDVFKTMLGLPAVLTERDKDQAEPWPPLSPVPNDPKPHIVGTVGFLGDASGLIYIYLEEAFAAQCTASLLGMTAAELKEAGPETVNDAVGELTNMIVGVFKNGLCDSGFSCKLTIPSILRGSNFCVASTGTSRRFTYSFEVTGRRVVADILMKTDES